jgi:hypothetical protein
LSVVIRNIAQKWNDRRNGKMSRLRRERDAGRLAEQALRCLRLSDRQTLKPRTMRDWFT